jgi:hypothetical protein
LASSSLLCSCGQNYGERPPVFSVANEEEGSLETALQTSQRDPTSIHTLRVPVNGGEVSLLTAVIMLEEYADIELVLNRVGADIIKASDQEKGGIFTHSSKIVI